MTEIVELAREHGTLIVHDFAYADLGFDGYTPPSILAGAGRQGCRGRDLLHVEELQHGRAGASVLPRQSEDDRGLARIKSYLDYGVFQPIQIASIVALRECEEDTARSARYIRGAAMCLWRVCAAPAGRLQTPRGSMFLWAPLPGGIGGSGRSSLQSCLWRRRWSPFRPVSVLVPWAKAMFVSRSSKTNIGPPGYPQYRAISEEGIGFSVGLCCPARLQEQHVRLTTLLVVAGDFCWLH